MLHLSLWIMTWTMGFVVWPVHTFPSTLGLAGVRVCEKCARVWYVFVSPRSALPEGRLPAPPGLAGWENDHKHLGLCMACCVTAAVLNETQSMCVTASALFTHRRISGLAWETESERWETIWHSRHTDQYFPQFYNSYNFLSSQIQVGHWWGIIFGLQASPQFLYHIMTSLHHSIVWVRGHRAVANAWGDVA